MTREEAIKTIYEALETLIPELSSESEDERTRKEIVDFIQWAEDKEMTREDYYEAKRPAVWIAYLEKLEGQKNLYYDKGFAEGLRQSKLLANSEIIVNSPKTTNKVSVSEELYEHIRETCACIDDAMSSKTLVDITDYLEMADKSAQAAFDMLEKQKEQKPAEWSEEDERKYQCIRSILLTDVDKKIGSWKYSEILEWYEKRGIGRYTNSQPHWKPSKELQINIERIHRVVCDDNEQSATPETYWTTDLQGCKSYIENRDYKDCLHLEEAVVTDKVLAVNGRR